MFFTVLLLFGSITPGIGLGPVFAANIGTNTEGIDYNDNVPNEIAVSVNVAPDLKVAAEVNEVFSGGNIRFDIAEGSDSSEKLKLPDGEYTLEGGQKIAIINGTIYMDSNGDGDYDDPGEDIAKVNDSLNGDGTSLQIDFSTIPIPNGNFEEGSVGEFIPVPNWTINNSSNGPNGTAIEQIWLGDLATKTQSRRYDSVISNGDGTYTVTGPGGSYTYVTNVDYNQQAISKDYQYVEGYEAVFGTLEKYVSNVYVDKSSSSQALEIGFLNARLKSGDYNVLDGKIASSFGIEAISDPFEANAGDQLGFDWKANDGGDDYEVYGFLVNEATQEHTEILYGRGSAQSWTTNTGVIPKDGTYRFRFVAGSFNRTDGTTHGATLSIDNIRILSGKVVASIAEQIGHLVTYETTKLLGDRHVNITLTNGVGEPSNEVTVPILMDNELERSLTINIPHEGELIYGSSPAISGNVLDGSTVSVTVTGPNGYVYMGNAIVTDSGWLLNGIDELIVPGVYEISVTATNADLETNPAITSTFNFVNKAELEAYVDVVSELNQNDYQAGWEDSAEGNMGFASALQAAKELLKNIADTSDGLNPDQAAVDAALADLKAAKAALERHSPIETVPAIFEHGGKEITIDFNKNVVLTNTANPAEGFTILINGEEHQVTSAIANRDKVTLTIDQPLNSDAENITVIYKKNTANPNLYGDEENGSPDEDFTVIATDEYGSALQIQTITGNTDVRTPVLTGTSHIEADQIRITIYDQQNNPVLTNVEATMNSGGTWTYTIPVSNELLPGSYTFEVTAIDTENSRSVTKSATFTVINKTELQTEYDEVNNFKADDYRAGWEEFEAARNRAYETLNNPSISQEEVDRAFAELEAKRDLLEKHPPIAKNATFEHGTNEIILEFDKNVTFTGDESGNKHRFSVFINGEKVNVITSELIDSDHNGDTNKVKLTLPNEALLSSDANVKVEYTKTGDSSLVGKEENGTAVEDFMFQAGDLFGKSVQINLPKNITNDTTPAIKGTVDPGADRATITILDSEGNVVVKLADIDIQPAGTWTYQVRDRLAPGEYVVEVTVSEDGRSDVTKQHTFIVVDKDELIAIADKIYKEKHEKAAYTEESWTRFVEASNHAKNVIADPEATQAEVEQAKADLAEAYQELVYKADLMKEEAISKELVENHYSKASWAVYQRALANAINVLNNPKATQAEINEALNQLKQARESLTVDKESLESQIKQEKNFNAADYTKLSWKLYQKALKKAKDVLANPKATQVEIDEAYANLLEAQAGLIKDKSDSLLPKTATNTYNMLVIGFGVVILGLVLLVLQRRFVKSNAE